MRTHLSVGQVVRNKGILAVVESFHPVTGCPVLRPFYADGTRWMADAQECTPVTTVSSSASHLHGAVVFDMEKPKEEDAK